MIGHFLTRQFLGFVAVGGLAAFLHWLARIILSRWLPFAAAIVLAYLVGMAVAFALNRRFVFPRSDRPLQMQARDFVLVNLAFLPVVLAATILLESLFRSWGLAFSKAFAHGIAVAIPTLATFLIYKFFAFRETMHGRN